MMMPNPGQAIRPHYRPTTEHAGGATGTIPSDWDIFYRSSWRCISTSKRRRNSNQSRDREG